MMWFFCFENHQTIKEFFSAENTDHTTHLCVVFNPMHIKLAFSCILGVERSTHSKCRQTWEHMLSVPGHLNHHVSCPLKFTLFRCFVSPSNELFLCIKHLVKARGCWSLTPQTSLNVHYEHHSFAEGRHVVMDLVSACCWLICRQS